MWIVFSFACLALVLSNSPTVTATITVSTTDFTNRIAAGDHHTCAISNDNTVWCWGENISGQLGSSEFLDDFSLVPTRANLPTSVIPIAIEAGARHTCILDSNSDVYCWGSNGSGALGNFQGDQYDPQLLPLNEDATNLAVGGKSSCANTDSSIKCWGENISGQLGKSVFPYEEDVSQEKLREPSRL